MDFGNNPLSSELFYLPSYAHTQMALPELTTTNFPVQPVTFAPLTSSSRLVSCFEFERPLEQVTTVLGENFKVYKLSGSNYNCALYGIYGHEDITREEVVCQLLSFSESDLIRELIACDILSYILSKKCFPKEIELRYGSLFRKLAEEYYKDEGSDEVRQCILQKLANPGIFRGYVRFFIGGRINDDINEPYNMLTYIRNTANEHNFGGALAAIAAINGVSLRIYQRYPSGILHQVSHYQNNQPNAPIIHLFHTSEDPLNSHPNHFNLLIPSNLEIGSSQNRDRELEEFKTLKRSFIGKLHTFKIEGYSEEDQKKTNQVLQNQFERLLELIESPTYLDILKVAYEVIQKQIDLQLAMIPETTLSRTDAGWDPLSKISFEDNEFQDYINQWKRDFQFEWDKFNKLLVECPYLNKPYSFIVKNKINREPLYNLKGFQPSYFYIVASEGWSKILNLLLAKRLFDVNERIGVANPLYIAAQEGHAECVRLLLRAKADFKISFTNFKQTALHVATLKGHAAVINLLLDAGANPNVINAVGDSPLILATLYNFEEIIFSLINKKANVNHCGWEGKTALTVASPRGYSNAVNIFINTGAHTDILDKYGSSPLLYATLYGYLDIVKALLQKGADANLGLQGELINNSKLNRELTSKCMRPIHIATERGYFDILQELVQWGADINLASESGLTPIHLACLSDNLPIVKYLLENDAKVNVYAKESKHTPLTIAVLNNNYDIVEMLLHNGADMYARDNQKRSPFKLSLAKGKKQINKLFLSFKENLIKVKKPDVQSAEAEQPYQKPSEEIESQKTIIDEITQLSEEEEEDAVELEIDQIEENLEWNDQIKKNFEDLWKEDHEKKPNKRRRQSSNNLNLHLGNEKFPRISDTKLTGSKRDLREYLKLILIEQPDRAIHKNKIKFVFKELRGIIKLHKGNKYKIYLGDKYIGCYEALHDKNPKGYLTMGYVKRVAAIICRVIKYNLINGNLLLPYLPEEWEMPI